MQRYLGQFVRNFCSSKAPRNVNPLWHHPIRNTINKAFGKYLLTTNILSSGVLMLIGDIAQQEIEYQRHMLKKRYDLARLGRMFAVGLALGPLHHYYYRYIIRLYPERDFTSISKKILLDQFVMSPICIVGFFYCMGLMEEKRVDECTSELRRKFLEVYTVDWLFWPGAQFITFYFIPDRYQVFYINAVQMVYNVFLSYIKHREVAAKCSQELQKHESTAVNILSN